MVSRRFIAGAVCPGCGEVDKVYVIELDGRKTRRCTRCEFEETLDESALSNRRGESGSQVIKIKDR